MKNKLEQEPLPVWLLRLLGFFSGGAVMIVEFTGNRLLSPSYGNSLYTWTGLISVILVALSAGDYVGGVVVDRYPHFVLLPIAFAIAGLFTAAIPGLFNLFAPTQQPDLVTGPISISLLLFFIPGIVLAMVTPISIRLLSRARQDAHIGQSAGTVGMAAALGSFAGTLLTSYYLIPSFGVRHIFVVLGATLCLLAIVLALLDASLRKKYTSLTALAILAAASSAWGWAPPKDESSVIFSTDSFYHHIVVKEMVTGGPDGRSHRTRILQLDSTMEGAQDIDSGDLIFQYQQYWLLSTILCPKVDRAAFLGAGAFGMPEKISAHFPQAKVHVVEIDPEVIKVGHRFFRLDQFPNVEAVAADARRFIRFSDHKFDFIFGDAYNGVQFVPPHLVTTEFFAEVRDHLTPDGVFVMNLIGAAEGSGSVLFWHVMNSVRAAFPDTLLFGVNPRTPSESQNLIIVASASPLEPRIDAWKKRVGSTEINAARLLETRIDVGAAPDGMGQFTDDHNPVELTVARQLRRR